ncbi:phosphate ABC transporter substrate-binding protein [Bacillus sp. FSL K6-4563]|uniref:phosphate ABC transporter substrate-binding protein n=1 Tax=Bacillus TaxID=1386 RepID=UPI00017A6858|nr:MULTISPECIES: phosphate ABC transporter substrate-binding protein [Bacillus]EDW20147.1 phosphate ABC superfamily ATP binding cassette transporter, binding protein [Bacillus pumilus ATCC 7061]KMY21895.1 phosphate-binding protein [Bacillus pumilus]MBR0590198.1 phosphate ABC transporter substrate-binding protein [Bacillus pumilus sxm20-2]MCI4616169.1 phosphate ABC transporter substrate-binding protein [Bacillus pumilus]MCM3147084.1 phosphate ABC transporter substrate-binding protein [Bacillus 
MKKNKLWLLTFLTIALLAFVTACGNSSSSGDSKDSKGNASNKDEASGSITISGSSAMQPLVLAAAEKFMDKHPKADIQVQAGGSGTGLSQVSEGSVQIGNSDVFAEEKDGIDAKALTDHKVAVVGMAAAVNPEVGVKDITKDELKKIFTGKIKNWKELGGKDQKITLVNRPDSSGTRATFVKYALDGATPAEGITEDSSNTVKKLIAETPGAIGYLAFSYLTDDKITPLSIDGVKPEESNVESGKYTIWAYEHSYTKGEPDGLAKQFLDYLMSDEVQKEIVKDQGYISVANMKVERDATGKQTDK